jgi:dimethylamine--corrinoid protein Co-methyltransferase
VGTGDPNGMGMAHALASSMGGIKTAGDLVARMQLNEKMRLTEAKQYVADKLGVSVFDLSDSTVMRTVREEFDIGVVTAVPGLAKGLEAKARIADLLGIRINSVERLKAKTGLGARVDQAGGTT